MNPSSTQELCIGMKHASPSFALPEYGLGTWGMGGTTASDCSTDAPCVEAIRRALNMGIRHIDTAEMYGSGHAEELIGRAIMDTPRESLFLGSKALAHHLRQDDLLAAAEGSISRMGCDYLDLYMVHHPTDAIPIAETMRGMDRLVRLGLVRHTGVANFTAERLKEAQHYATNKIVVNQVHYSLTVREPERTRLLEFCCDNDILVVAWQPIDRGIYSSQPSPVLKDVCNRYGMTPVQVALSWLVSQPGVVAICRTMSEAHLRENISAAQTKLAPEDVELLRKKFEPQQERSAVYPLG